MGLVTDPTGAIVPEATVSLIDHTTGTTKTTTTNEAGRYIFVNVNPGIYDITVNKTGFTQARFAQQEVSIGRQLTVDATLKVGAATQEVVVEASGTTLQTLNSTVGTTIGQQSLQELPNLSRDVSSLLTLQGQLDQAESEYRHLIGRAPGPLVSYPLVCGRPMPLKGTSLFWPGFSPYMLRASLWPRIAE